MKTRRDTASDHRLHACFHQLLFLMDVQHFNPFDMKIARRNACSCELSDRCCASLNEFSAVLQSGTSSKARAMTCGRDSDTSPDDPG